MILAMIILPLSASEHWKYSPDNHYIFSLVHYWSEVENNYQFFIDA